MYRCEHFCLVCARPWYHEPEFPRYPLNVVNECCDLDLPDKALCQHCERDGWIQSGDGVVDVRHDAYADFEWDAIYCAI